MRGSDRVRSSPFLRRARPFANTLIPSEMLHHAMKGAEAEDTTMTLRAEDATSAGDNLTFLKSKLVWEMGDDGKERVMDADGNGYV